MKMIPLIGEDNNPLDWTMHTYGDTQTHRYRRYRRVFEDGLIESYVESMDRRTRVLEEMSEAKIDSFNIEYRCEGTESVFEKLYEDGYRCNLMSRLMCFEQEDLELRPDGRTDVFFKTRIISRCPETRAVIQKQYYIPDTAETLQKIASYDQYFFGQLLHACRHHSYVRITRLDLCVDFSTDFMPDILRALFKNQYVSHKKQPYGYGVIGGENPEFNHSEIGTKCRGRCTKTNQPRGIHSN